MSKIVKAINVLISKNDLISNVKKGCDGKELFFCYNGKHKWSIHKNNENDYFLHYYPGTQSIDYLAQMEDYDWADFDEMMTYQSSELATKEAYSSLSELYSIVREKIYKMDTVLDDIIKDEYLF